MGRYTLWSRQNKREERDFHEKAYRREGMAEWDDRWHRLSTEARSAFLDQLKAPPRSPGPGSMRPGVSVESIAPRVVEELVEAGFAELGSSRMIGPRNRVFIVEAATDFSARVRALHRIPMLREGGSAELQRYLNSGFFVSMTLNVLN